MIIRLDDRTGQEGLKALLEPRVTVVVERMPFGDAAFDGHGPKGTVAVGVEIKKLGDILTCVTDQRYSGHQLPGMVASYDICYLVIEGDWGCGPKGEIVETLHRGNFKLTHPSKTRLTFSEFTKWLHTLEVRAGQYVMMTGSRERTAALLVDLAAWWAKPWAQHSAHLAFEPKLWLKDSALLIRPGFASQVAKELPGVGWEKSKAVVERFKTVQRMVEATEEEWRQVPGIGPTLASRIWRAWRGIK